MEVEVSLEEPLGLVVDLEEFVLFVGEFGLHGGEVGELLEVVGGEGHVASSSAFVYAFGEDVAGVPGDVLVELDCDLVVPADELSEVGYL